MFGVTPLQQYLVALPGGRYQALGIAWDSRPKRDGGQRWFHLYPGEGVDHRDVLHWTKPSQNWNTQCAECHSTNLRKGYRWPEDRFVTTFSEIDVGCEACHGPGSRHVELARVARARGRTLAAESGLIVRFTERRSRTWEMDAARGIARPTKFLESRLEIETCARCHGRRGVLSEDYQPGRLLSQTHRPALLDEGLYYADGQMKDEVYNWGSFLQSRMYAVGVTCADCHDAHDLKVKVGRDDVCSSCHQPERFATRKHHFHRENGKGASCVACHMRTETYMGVDARHDHSLRVPRPDLTVELGAGNAPNACNDCHRDRTARWAAQAVRRFYPEGTPDRSRTTARRCRRAAATPSAPRRRCWACCATRSSPASCAPRRSPCCRPHMGPDSLPAVQKAAASADPLLRLAAASVLETLPAGRAHAGRRVPAVGPGARGAGRSGARLRRRARHGARQRAARGLRPRARRLLARAADERRAARVARQPRHRLRQARPP